MVLTLATDMRRVLLREGVPYLIQWRVLRSRLISVYVHNILRADLDPDLHTHPYRRVLSLKLKGSYTEQTLLGLRRPRRLDWVRSPHRIAAVDGPVWSIFVGLGRLPAWGFIRNGVLVLQ